MPVPCTPHTTAHQESSMLGPSFFVPVLVVDVSQNKLSEGTHGSAPSFFPPWRVEKDRTFQFVGEEGGRAD